MPWSVKAQALLREQYTAVGAASRAALAEVTAALGVAETFGLDVAELQERYARRVAMASRFVDAYRRYCWPVRGIADLRLAPFHLLATEGVVHVHRDHLWHIRCDGTEGRADRA